MEQNDRFEKLRLPLAIVLSLVVALGYFAITSRLRKNAPVPPTPITAPAAVQIPSAASSSGQAPMSAAIVSVPVAKKNLPVSQVILSNEYLEIRLSSENACVYGAKLLRSPYNPSEVEFEAEALPTLRTGDVFFSDKLAMNLPRSVYELVEAKATFVIFRQALSIGGKSLTVIKRFELQGHELKMLVRLENGGRETISGSYLVLNGSSIGVKNRDLHKSPYDRENLSYMAGENFEIALSDMKLGMFSSEQFAVSKPSVNWISIDNRFHLRTLHSLAGISDTELIKFPSADVTNLAGALRASFSTGSGLADEKTWVFTMLPKSRGLLNDIYKKTDRRFFAIFDQTTVFKILADWMYYIMLWIYSIVPDMGWAVVILTVLLKLITWPLNQKSYKAMQKMQMLAPKIKEINEKHKKNPQQKNIEVMNLYKREKANPASGCVPMLIPIPIFIALYALFLNMIEMSGAPWLWIPDMSLPDTVGFFPFTLPFLGSHFPVNILPVIMTLATFLQSVFQPQPQGDQASGQMTFMKYGMPLLFLFICYSMPAALVLFWTLNSLFGFIQSFLVRRSMTASQA